MPLFVDFLISFCPVSDVFARLRLRAPVQRGQGEQPDGAGLTVGCFSNRFPSLNQTLVLVLNFTSF